MKVFNICLRELKRLKLHREQIPAETQVQH